MSAIRLVGAILVLALPAVGCSSDRGDVRVMTQNVYYGFDVGPLLAASSPDEIPVLAAQAFQQLLSTDFPERAEAIADEIARQRPHLIGLQEVALYRIQSPGDAVVGGTTPAETVFLDYLDLLLSALAARGLDYRVAAKVQNVDVELPMVTGTDPVTFDDIRLTDYDVILSEGGLQISNVVAANYQAKLFIPSLALEVPRGYVAVHATLPGGRTIRFATTHLEDTPFPEVQFAQAQELVAALAPHDQQVVLVGDFNSPAPSGVTYAFLASQGYIDAWGTSKHRTKGDGFTWGHSPDLRNDSDTLTQRLDLVLYRSDGGPFGRQALSVNVWGDDLDERTPSGLWPSDHAGVEARLTR